MLIESIFTKKSPSLKDCPLSALFILPVPVLLALMVLGFWGKLWEGTGACRASSCPTSAWAVGRASAAVVERKSFCLLGTKKWLSVPAAALRLHAT